MALKIQSIIFDRELWDYLEAKAWLKKHKYKFSDVDRTRYHYRFRQIDPKKIVKSSWATLKFGKDLGIKAVAGRLKK